MAEATSDRLSRAAQRQTVAPGGHDLGIAVEARRQRGARQAGADGIDPDMRRMIERHRPAEIDHRGLGGVIGGEAVIAAAARYRCDIDDAAPHPFQMGHGRTAGPHHRVQIDGEHLAPMGEIDVRNPPERAYPGIVDEDIEPAVSFHRKGYHRFDLQQVHHIDLDRAKPSPAIEAANDVKASARISAAITDAPSSRNRLTVASPMPEAPPVTIAVLPSRRRQLLRVILRPAARRWSAAR